MVLPDQRSSGIPEMLYGYAHAARETAEFNVAAVLPWIEGAAPWSVSAEPTATFAFKVHYPDYLASPIAPRWPTPPTTWASSWCATALDHPEAAPVARPLLRRP